MRYDYGKLLELDWQGSNGRKARASSTLPTRSPTWPGLGWGRSLRGKNRGLTGSAKFTYIHK